MGFKDFETQFESLPPSRRAPARRLAQRLVEHEEMRPDEAVLEALRRFGPRTRHDAPKDPRALTSPDVSLAGPHGPEGESHGGRGGRDPLRFVEDSTPKGTNAYSRSRGSPAESKKAFGRGRARIVSAVPPLERETKPRLRTKAAAGERGAVRKVPHRAGRSPPRGKRQRKADGRGARQGLKRRS